MATLSRLLVELGLDSSGFTKGVDSAKGAVGKLGGSFGEMAKGVAGGMLAASVVSGGFGEIKGQVEGAIHAGEEFQQTQLKTNAIFGKGAEEVTKWGEGAATSLGMSGGEAQKSADIFGNLFRNIGFTSGSLPGMSEKMTGVVANLAAFNNADPAEVMNAVGKAVVGSTKGLKQYGIVISQADIAQEALRETGKKSAKDLTTQEKTQAAYNLILDKTKNIQGSVADRSKTLAGASKILHAELANLQEEIGVKLLPVLTQLTIVAIKAVPILMAILTRFVIPLATALVNKLLPSLTLFWNATKKIIDVMILAFKGGKSFSDLLERIPGPLRPLAQALITIAAAVGDLVRAFQAGGIQGLLAELPKALGMLGDGFAQLGTVILGFIANELQSLVDAFAGLLDKIGLGDFGAAIQAEFGGIVTFIGDEITLIGDLIHGRWGKLWGDLKTLAIDALRLLIDDLKANLALIMDAFRGIDWGAVGATLLAGLSAALAGLGELAGWALNVGLPSLGGKILDVAKDFWGWIVGELPALGSLAGEIASWVFSVGLPSLGGLIKTGFTSTWDWLLGELPAVGSLAGDIGAWVLSTVMPSLGGLLKTGFTDAWTWLKGELPGIASLAGKIAAWSIDVGIPAVAGAIVTGATDMWAWVKSGVTWLADSISHALGFSLDVPVPSVGGKAVSAFSTIWAWVKSAVSWLADGVAWDLSFVLNLPIPSIAGKAVNAFKSMWDFIKSAISWLSDTVSQTIDVATDVSKVAMTVAPTAISDFENAIATAFGIAKSAGGWVWKNTVGAVISIVSDSGSTDTKAKPSGGGSAGFGGSASDLQSVSDQITGLVTTIQTNLDKLTSSFDKTNKLVFASLLGIANMMELFSATDTGMGLWGTNAGNNFNTNIYVGLLAAQTQTVPGVLNAILSSLDTFKAGFLQRATDAGNTFNTNIYVGLLAAQNTAAAVWSQMKTDVDTFAGAFPGYATTAGDNFNTNLGSGLNKAVSAAVVAAGAITGALDIGDQFNNGFNVGYSLGQGINSGISSWTSTIATTASDAVSGAIAAAKKAGGIASPSKAMMFVGDMLGKGAHMAFSRWVDPMAAAGADLVRNAIPNVTGASFGGLAGAGAGMGGNTFGDINITVVGNNDPKSTADQVFAVFAREMGLRNGV